MQLKRTALSYLIISNSAYCQMSTPFYGWKKRLTEYRTYWKLGTLKELNAFSFRRCTRRCSTKSIRDSSFFSNFREPLPRLTLLIWCWCAGRTIDQAMHLLSVQKRLIIHVYAKLERIHEIHGGTSFVDVVNGIIAEYAL